MYLLSTVPSNMQAIVFTMPQQSLCVLLLLLLLLVSSEAMDRKLLIESFTCQDYSVISEAQLCQFAYDLLWEILFFE
jgi:hypothetical protein